MNLEQVWQQWHTYTPLLLGNRDQEIPFTIQYKLVSKGEGKRIEALDEAGIAEERGKFASLAESEPFNEEWEQMPPSWHRDILLFASHIGTIDNLTVNGEQVQTLPHLLTVLPSVQALYLIQELRSCILGIREDPEETAEEQKRIFR